MSRPTFQALVRLWAEENKELLGLGLGLVVILVLMLAIFIGQVKIGPPQELTGTILKLGYLGPRAGTTPAAFVRYGGQVGWVILPRNYECVAGDRLRFQQQRFLWGVSSSADVPACPRHHLANGQR